ncbi:helix-turn-helix transcriptional regulator [Gilvimarinus sp. SDUM040013]|uniref:Helix-turn-helix transcriptional regulator n=1 Tax=Gilvimarinus gilvus TaxID=3058038 RepID=A0ABU4RWY7_9GAMM|nr:helix-turn-helix transcriptional regulator [Gilvimarinus sp. SDUM040013]MDO3386938.1 helix-turn-helix transcriptional regulator [Gilvimarinus sp. SDUM040013]MDX6848168.1 helix-turn-helix transcriptional regulator [Gilvimarinus sp. SDUM040013]
MTFTSLELADFILRGIATGQLLHMGLAHGSTQPHAIRISQRATISCMVAYLWLTAPLPDQFYGHWRGLLLLLTDGLIYCLWLLASYSFRDHFSLVRLPLWLQGLLTLYAAWFAYFFVIQQGVGLFHTINHVLVIVLALHIVYLAIHDYQDDLLDKRRRARIQVTCLVCVYLVFLAGVELAPEFIRHHRLYSPTNAVLVVLALVTYTVYAKNNRLSEALAPAAVFTQPQTAPHPLRQKLDQFIDSKAYQQTGLNLAALADHLNCSEYQLRKYISTELGYRNFSDFLNQHRLTDASVQLSNPELSSTPILTIALNCGFGSIGPFNRAFKLRFDCTPSEYRQTRLKTSQLQ